MIMSVQKKQYVRSQSQRVMFASECWLKKTFVGLCFSYVCAVVSSGYQGNMTVLCFVDSRDSSPCSRAHPW